MSANPLEDARATRGMGTTISGEESARAPDFCDQIADSAGWERRGGADRRRPPLLAVEAPPLPPFARLHRAELTFVVARHDPIDSCLVAGAVGVEAAFDALFLSFSERINGYLERRLGDKYEAEDLTQVVLMKALGALRRGDGPARPALKAWLFRIADNVLRDYQRRNVPVTLADATELVGWQEVASEPPELDWLTQPRMVVQVGRLSEREQRVLELRYRFDLPYEEIARLVGYSGPATVRTTQRRAIKALRSRLSEGGERGSRSAFGSSRLPTLGRRERGISVLPRFAPRTAAWGTARPHRF